MKNFISSPYFWRWVFLGGVLLAIIAAVLFLFIPSIECDPYYWDRNWLGQCG